MRGENGSPTPSTWSEICARDSNGVGSGDGDDWLDDGNYGGEEEQYLDDDSAAAAASSAASSSSAAATSSAAANDVEEDLCGTFGCTLPDRHPGLHQTPAIPAKRQRRLPSDAGHLRDFGLAAPIPLAPGWCDRQVLRGGASSSLPPVAAAAVASSSSSAASSAADPDPDDPDPDPTGCTDVDLVLHYRAELRSFANSGFHQGHGTLERFFVAEKIKREELDNRLCAQHTFTLYGLAPSAGASRLSNRVWKATARLQYLVSKEPSCLVIPEGPRGPWFTPIDQAWVDAANETFIPSTGSGHTSTRYMLLFNRVQTEMNHDAHGLIGLVRINPQPAGRYMTMPDVIKMWNRSRGWCGQPNPDGQGNCSRPIYLEWNRDWDEYEEEARPQPSNLACCQRLDNVIFHFSWNMADTLICARCNGKTTHNFLQPRCDPVADPVA